MSTHVDNCNLNILGNLLDVEVDLEVEPIDIKELGDISVPPLSLAKMHFLFCESDEMPEIPDVSPDK